MTYWEHLATVLNNETLADRDRLFLAMLKPLGTEKGKPSQPDVRQTKILGEAALVGEAMAKDNSFDKRFEGALYRPDSLLPLFRCPTSPTSVGERANHIL